MKDESMLSACRIIEKIIHNGARIIDLGCGDGELIYHLEKTKSAFVQGVELNENCIYKCVEKGLSVLHSDLDNGLNGFPNRIFDYVILNQSLQEVRRVEYVLEESFRVGGKGDCMFPQFCKHQRPHQAVFERRSPDCRRAAAPVV